jgi:hypothetical protein
VADSLIAAIRFEILAIAAHPATTRFSNWHG